LHPLCHTDDGPRIACLVPHLRSIQRCPMPDVSALQYLPFLHGEPQAGAVFPGRSHLLEDALQCGVVLEARRRVQLAHVVLIRKRLFCSTMLSRGVLEVR